MTQILVTGLSKCQIYCGIQFFFILKGCCNRCKTIVGWSEILGVYNEIHVCFCKEELSFIL